MLLKTLRKTNLFEPNFATQNNILSDFVVSLSLQLKKENIMSDKEIKQLTNLAANLKKEISKEKALATFVSAGILNKKGDFTTPYNGLKTVVVESRNA